VLTFALLAALTISPQQNLTTNEERHPVAAEQVLAWQLEGLTQEEIQEEVGAHGLTSYPDIAFLSALSAAGADAETIRAAQHAPGPRNRWGLALRLPKATDYLYEMAGAILWNDWEHAIQTMEKESRLQPNDATVQLVYAHVLSVKEDWIAAFGAATRAVALAPQSPYAHGVRSTVCYHAHLPECAVREALIFVELRPSDAASYITLAHAREAEGETDEALAALAQAEKLHAGYAEIYATRGRVYAGIGEYEKAVQSFERAIQVDRKEPRHHFQLAQLYLAEGYNRQAISELKLAKELAPNRPEVLLALGNAYLAQERYEAAAKEFQELLERQPELEVAREQLAKTLRAEGRLQEAEAVLNGPSVDLP
jgi:tetratricopeptide (TPR) repeat protein